MYKKWTQEEINYLKQYYPSQKISVIANHLDRNYSKVKHKIRNLKLHIPISKWTDKEVQYLKDNYIILGTKRCAKYLQKNPRIVWYKAKILNLIPIKIPTKTGHKICTKCKQEKTFKEFNHFSKGKYGLSSKCKVCINLEQQNNPNRKTNIKNYQIKNNKIINYKQRSKYHQNLEDSRKYNREKAIRLRLKWGEKYKEKMRKWKLVEFYQKKNNPIFILKKTLRSRFLRAVISQFKQTSVINLIGCSIEELRKYLESKFKQGMAWENHGIHGWHIDHIKPCDSFNLSDIEQQKLCFHYTNLQPLWAIDNLKKSNKI